jgi:hypothetical protein
MSHLSTHLFNILLVSVFVVLSSVGAAFVMLVLSICNDHSQGKVLRRRAVR